MATELDCQGASTNRKWAEEWLSAPRFATYLDVCSGDASQAIDLHEWNLRLAQAVLCDIAHFELALRNRYCCVLSAKLGGAGQWLFDDASPLIRPILRKSKSGKLRDVNIVNRRAISDAVNRAHNPSNPDQVISGLMLGFWAHMTDRSRERDLWIPYLNAAWPKGTDRADLHLRIYAINRLRNRAAHNERLFNPRDNRLLPTKVDAEVVALMQALCPEAHAYLYGGSGRSAVERFLLENPLSVAISV